MPVTQRKPEWRGGTHPLAMLHGNAAWGELLDHQGWLLNHGQSEADAIDRDIDRALARGMLPTRLGRRMKRITRALRQMERLQREMVAVDEEMYERHYIPAELAAIARARRAGED